MAVVLEYFALYYWFLLQKKKLCVEIKLNGFLLQIKKLNN